MIKTIVMMIDTILLMNYKLNNELMPKVTILLIIERKAMYILYLNFVA